MRLPLPPLESIPNPAPVPLLFAVHSDTIEPPSTTIPLVLLALAVQWTTTARTEVEIPEPTPETPEPFSMLWQSPILAPNEARKPSPRLLPAVHFCTLL